MKLWLDDRRPAPLGWACARTAVDAIALLATGTVEIVSLDHDLADDHYLQQGPGYTSGTWTGLDVARYIALMPAPPRIIYIHSMNPVGVQRMIDALGAVGIVAFRVYWADVR